MVLMKKTPLDMRHQLMARSPEVASLPSHSRSVINQASCVCCVSTSGTRREVLIWFVKINLHTLII